MGVGSDGWVSVRSVKVMGLGDEACCRWEETVLMARGFSFDGLLPPSRGEASQKICVQDGRGQVQSYLRGSTFPLNKQLEQLVVNVESYGGLF